MLLLDLLGHDGGLDRLVEVLVHARTLANTLPVALGHGVERTVQLVASLHVVEVGLGRTEYGAGVRCEQVVGYALRRVVAVELARAVARDVDVLGVRVGDAHGTELHDLARLGDGLVGHVGVLHVILAPYEELETLVAVGLLEHDRSIATLCVGGIGIDRQTVLHQVGVDGAARDTVVVTHLQTVDRVVRNALRLVVGTPQQHLGDRVLRQLGLGREHLEVGVPAIEHAHRRIELVRVGRQRRNGVDDCLRSLHGRVEEEGDLTVDVEGLALVVGLVGTAPGGIARHAARTPVVLLEGSLEERHARLEQQRDLLADALAVDVGGRLELAAGRIEILEDEACHLVARSAHGVVAQHLRVVGQHLLDDRQVTVVHQRVVVSQRTEEVGLAQVVVEHAVVVGDLVIGRLHPIDQEVPRTDGPVSAGEHLADARLPQPGKIVRIAAAGDEAVGVVVVSVDVVGPAAVVVHAVALGSYQLRSIVVDHVGTHLVGRFVVGIRRDVGERLTIEPLVARREAHPARSYERADQYFLEIQFHIAVR